MIQIADRDRGLNRLTVGRACRRKPASVRVSPHLHHLLDREGEVAAGVLRQERQVPRDVASGHPRKRCALQTDLPGMHAAQSGQGSQQRTLATAVRTHDRGERSCGQGNVDVLQDRPASEHDLNVLRLEHETHS
jgi:hypothetical protein